MASSASTLRCICRGKYLSYSEYESRYNKVFGKKKPVYKKVLMKASDINIVQSVFSKMKIYLILSIFNYYSINFNT